MRPRARLQVFSKMKPALVCFALEEEAAPFRRLVSAKSGASILITGIGRQNAATAVGKVVALHKPALVLSCGFAGALNAALATGDVVFSTADGELYRRLLAAGAKPAKFHCAARIAATAAEKQTLRHTTSADAVEMESEMIHDICGQRGIPCATVRAISDTAEADLPLDFNTLSKSDMSLDYGRLALAVAKSPGKIPALLRLRRKCKLAASRLAAVLKEAIQPES